MATNETAEPVGRVRVLISARWNEERAARVARRITRARRRRSVARAVVTAVVVLAAAGLTLERAKRAGTSASEDVAASASRPAGTIIRFANGASATEKPEQVPHGGDHRDARGATPGLSRVEIAGMESDATGTRLTVDPLLAPSHDEVVAELAAADALRAAGRFAEAAAAFSAIAERRATDPRAALAAFTAGRILVENLARPRDAARAFERAATLAPAGPLAADARERVRRLGAGR